MFELILLSFDLFRLLLSVVHVRIDVRLVFGDSEGLHNLSFFAVTTQNLIKSPNRFFEWF